MDVCDCPECGYGRMQFHQQAHKYTCPRCKNDFYWAGENKAHRAPAQKLMKTGKLSTYMDWEKAPWET